MTKEQRRKIMTDEAFEELDDLFLIREDDGEWREPLLEAEESNDKE